MKLHDKMKRLKLGEKVKIIRDMKQISQTWLGMKLGMTQQAYQKLEQGKTIMTNSRLSEIAKLLDVDEQTIRDIDKLPLINLNPKNCNQFGNYQPTYHNYDTNEATSKINEEDRIKSIESEVRSLKTTIDTLTKFIESKLNHL